MSAAWRWIPVGESLPPAYEKVLCFGPRAPYPFIGFQQPEGGFCVLGSSWTDRSVTHWCRWPEVPNAERH